MILKTYKLTIPGRLTGLNEYTGACRENKYTGARMKRQAETTVRWMIAQQLRGLRINRPVYLKFTWYEQSKRRDLDNISSFGRKVIQDALVKAGVLKDDGWDYITGFSDDFKLDRKCPRIVVEIIEQPLPEQGPRPRAVKGGPRNGK